MIFIRYFSTRLVEEPSLADFETWLRNYSNCFRVFFVAILVGYAALGIGWIRLFRYSRGRQKRASSNLLLVGVFTSYFMIAFSSVAFLVAGLELEGLQAPLLEVWDQSRIVKKCG